MRNERLTQILLITICLLLLLLVLRDSSPARAGTSGFGEMTCYAAKNIGNDWEISCIDRPAHKKLRVMRDRLLEKE